MKNIFMVFAVMFSFSVKSYAAESLSKSKEAPSKSYQSLTEDERKILVNGEISTARYVIGGVIGTYPVGFGVGHAIQGRYSDKGWIFTAGELGSLVAIYAGLGSCVGSMINRNDCSESSAGLVFAGVMGFVGFRVWEIIDLWATPPEINRKYYELKRMTGGGGVTWRPFVAPVNGQPGLGLAMTF